MAANVNTLHRWEAPAQTESPTVIPTPANVRARAAEIRSSWSPRQKRRRAKAARNMLLHQLLVEAEPVRPADDEPSGVEATLPLTPRHSPAR